MSKKSSSAGKTGGYILLGLGIAAFLAARRSGNTSLRGAFTVVLGAIVLQAVIGIMTVLYVAPWHLALLHQLTAVALWTLILRAGLLARMPRPQSVRDR